MMPEKSDLREPNTSLQRIPGAMMVAAILSLLVLAAWGVDHATRPDPAQSADSNREPRKFLYFHLSTPAGAKHVYTIEGGTIEFPHWESSTP